MKLRLNATLRAALIAAVTAVGFTLTQAQAGSATAPLTPTTSTTNLSGFGGFSFTVGEGSPYQPTTGKLIYSTADPITLNSIDLNVYASWYTKTDSKAGFGGAVYKYDADHSNYVLVSKTDWWKNEGNNSYEGNVQLTLAGGEGLQLVQDTTYVLAFYAGETYFNDTLALGSTRTDFAGAAQWGGAAHTDSDGLAAVGIRGATSSSGITLYQAGTSGPTQNYTPNVVLNITYTAPDVKDYIWNGTSGSHAWSDSVWNTGSQTNVPFVNGGNAAFTATGNATVDITTSVIAHNVTVGGKDYTFVIQSGGSLAADTVELAADGNLTIENNSGSSQAVGAVSGAGNMILTAGTFSIGDFASSGKLVVSDNGTLELGNTRHNIGTLEIGDGGVVTTTHSGSEGCVSGDINIKAGGTFRVAGQHDAFGWGGTATKNIILTGEEGKLATLELNQTTTNSVTMKTNISMHGYSTITSTNDSKGFNTYGGSIFAENTNNNIDKIQLRDDATIEVATAGELSVGDMIYGQSGSHNLTKTGEGTLTFTGTANMKTLNLTKGTVVLNGTSSVENGLTVASGATLSSQTGTTTAAITFADGACLDVGNGGLVLAGTSSFGLDGKINFSTSDTKGYGEIIVATGLSKESISGITFDGEDIAVASNYLVLQPELKSYTQLKFKDNSLVLLREENGSYWGKDKGDGNWDLTSTNWAPADGQDAVRIFVEDAPAHFTEAGGGGTITVTQNVKAEFVNVSGEKEYIFTAGGGELTVVNSVNVGENAKATFYIPLSGTELALNVKEGGTLNIGADSGVKTVTDKGTLTVAGGKKLTTSGAVTLGNNAVLGGTGTIEAGSVVLATGGEEYHAELKDGATLKTNSISGTGVLHVMGTSRLVATDDASYSEVEMKETSVLEIAEDKTLTVEKHLALTDNCSVANKGTLSAGLAGDILVDRGELQLGNLDIVGLLHVTSKGVSTKATGGVIGALMLDYGSSLTSEKDLTVDFLTMSNVAESTLTVGENLQLGQTATNKGKVTVTGATTITGAVKLTSLSSGSLDLTKTGSLTTTGAVDVKGAITLGRLSKDEVYLKAGSLTNATTQFEVTLEDLEKLALEPNQTLTLADVDAAHGAAGNLRINGEVTIQDSRDIIYTISQDTSTWDIILTADNAPSDYIWTNDNTTERWSDNLNWSGKEVPGREDWAQVNPKEGVGSFTIQMDTEGEAKRFTVAPKASAKLTGVNDLTIHQSLEVNATGILYIAGSVAVKAPLVQDAGLLFVTESGSLEASQVDVTETMKTLDNAYVKADTLNVREGIFIAGGGEVESGALNLTVSCLMVNEQANMHTNTLDGDADSTIQGPGVLNVNGKGGVYSGAYTQARIHVSANGDQTLAAREGLSAEGLGTVRLQYAAPASIDRVSGNGMTLVLNSPNTDNTGAPLTLTNPSAVQNGQIVTGLSAVSSAITLNTAAAPIIIQATSLNLGGSTVIVNQTETDVQKLPISTSGQTEGLVLAYLGAEDSFAAVTLNGNLFNRYYINPRLEAGRILVDLNTTHVLDQIEATTYNGRAGAHMLDDAFRQLDPQMAMPTGDLAAVMNALEEGRIPRADTDRMAAAMAGASYAAMGSAFSKDVERQLRSIRNRTTSMGCAECVVNEDMPYVNAWVNAEGEFRKMNRENTLAGYTLNSWGATLGVDVDFTPRFTAGVAFTYLQGDFTSRSADMGDGDLDRMYVSAFARYNRRAWTHTFVGTFGRADASLDRTVDYGAGRYSTKGDTDGTAFGLMYEAGYTVALSEDASTCLQPVFNVLYRHSSLGGYTETGSDAALKYADAEADVVTFGLGARLQSAVGTSAFNRHTLLETRALIKLDAGDRDVTPQANFVGVGGMQKIKSSEYGAFGVEIGAGVMIPIGEGASSLFFDVSAEFRSGYSDVNGAAGYRVNF